MAISKINLKESNGLEFSVSLQGAETNSAKTRFCVVTEDKEIAFTGSVTDGKVKFNIPVLENIIKPGTYECKLEVMVDEYYFVPLNETIEFMVPVGVQDAAVIKQEEKGSKPTLSIGNITIKETKEPPKVSAKAIMESLSSIIEKGEKNFVTFNDGVMGVDPHSAHKVTWLKENLDKKQLKKFNKMLETKSTFLKLVNLKGKS